MELGTMLSHGNPINTFTHTFFNVYLNIFYPCLSHHCGSPPKTKSAFVRTYQVEQEIKTEKQINDAGVGYHAAQHFDRNL
jgi:hypothetical protein